MDRIEKLYSRWAHIGIDEDAIHVAVDNLLSAARIADDEDEVYGDPDAARMAVLDTLADLTCIEPDYTGPWHVVRYEVTRHYGGAEEGGWYFDSYASPELVATFASDRKMADHLRTHLNEEAKDERIKEGRHQGRFSVLGGEDIVYVIEKEVGETETTEAPRYE
jgi:hypothetical protein